MGASDAISFVFASPPMTAIEKPGRIIVVSFGCIHGRDLIVQVDAQFKSSSQKLRDSKRYNSSGILPRLLA